MAENLNKILEAANVEYEGKKIVAFIGKVGFGKTVVSTLMYDVLSNAFLRQYGKKFDVRPIKGYDDIEGLHAKILKGRFPGRTLPETKSEIVIEISSKEAPIGKIDLFLRDASGEDLRNVLYVSYDDDPNKLLRIILTKHKKDNEAIGPLSYLIHAKLYVILIDCEKFNEWRSEQTRFVQLVNSILDIKKAMGQTVNEKIIDPIAIIFTKSDRLKKYIDEGQIAKDITAKELLQTELRLLSSTLNVCHAGKLECFRFSIDGVEEASEEEARQWAEEEKIVAYEKMKENRRKLAERVRAETIENRVEKAIDEKRQEAIKAGHPAAAAEEMARKAGEEQRLIAEEELRLDDSSIESYIKKYLDENTPKQFFKIKLPIKYSEREYIRFILWIIETLAR